MGELLLGGLLLGGLLLSEPRTFLLTGGGEGRGENKQYKTKQNNTKPFRFLDEVSGAPSLLFPQKNSAVDVDTILWRFLGFPEGNLDESGRGHREG